MLENRWNNCLRRLFSTPLEIIVFLPLQKFNLNKHFLYTFQIPKTMHRENPGYAPARWHPVMSTSQLLPHCMPLSGTQKQQYVTTVYARVRRTSNEIDLCITITPTVRVRPDGMQMRVSVACAVFFFVFSLSTGFCFANFFRSVACGAVRNLAHADRTFVCPRAVNNWIPRQCHHNLCACARARSKNRHARVALTLARPQGRWMRADDASESAAVRSQFVQDQKVGGRVCAAWAPRSIRASGPRSAAAAR